ncbi:MAG: CheR family methyltransferase [Anaerovoracaceae bacterium]
MLTLKDDEFHFIVSFMKSNYGIILEKKRPLIEGREKKRPLIEGRLSNHVAGLGFQNYMDYFKYAMEGKENKTNDEIITIINKLTTNHTYFLRESEHFTFYKEIILPWVDKNLKSNDLRVWSAGCSSGQEPYTLSMITLDYLGHNASEWDSTLLASDISNKALLAAKKGVYSSEELIRIPKIWMKKYFTKLDRGNYAVTDLIKNNVAFRNFNLLSPFNFKKPFHAIFCRNVMNLLSPFNFKKPFHAIFCRNVMIYFDMPTKKQIIDKFYDALLPGGYLLIGHSESLSSCKHNFKYLRPSVYQKV